MYPAWLTEHKTLSLSQHLPHKWISVQKLTKERISKITAEGHTNILNPGQNAGGQNGGQNCKGGQNATQNLQDKK